MAANQQLKDAELSYRKGKYADAVQLSKKMADEASEKNDNGKLFDALLVLGRVYTAQAFYEDASRVLQKALALAAEEGKDGNLKYAAAQNALAQNLIFLEHFADAEKLLQEALLTRKSRAGAQSPEVAETLENLGALYLAENK
jgi:tetratricopeptide (TPR) repeat protein